MLAMGGAPPQGPLAGDGGIWELRGVDRKPLLRPRALRAGDAVAVVSPSWSAAALYRERTEHALRALDRAGFRPRLMPNALRADGHRAGRPAERADDFNRALRDPEIRGIVASIGGWNANELLGRIDLDALRSDPKVICGYSDMDTLLLALQVETGLVTFHGPMLLPQWGEAPDVLPYTKDQFLRATTRPEPLGVLSPPGGWTAEFLDWDDGSERRARRLTPHSGWAWWRRGRARGPLLGGHAAVVLSLAATRWWPSWDGAVLLWEEAESHVPEVERRLWNLRHLGVFDRISGMIAARGDLDPFPGSLSLEEVVLEATEGYAFPILAEVDCGHTDPILTLPLGVEVALDDEGPAFSILEPAVVGETRSAGEGSSLLPLRNSAMGHAG